MQLGKVSLDAKVSIRSFLLVEWQLQYNYREQLECIQLNQQICINLYYRIAGNFGGSKLWRMVLNLRFGEFNFGGLS